jgi:hypothetical protein
MDCEVAGYNKRGCETFGHWSTSQDLKVEMNPQGSEPGRGRQPRSGPLRSTLRGGNSSCYHQTINCPLNDSTLPKRQLKRQGRDTAMRHLIGRARACAKRDDARPDYFSEGLASNFSNWAMICVCRWSVIAWFLSMRAISASYRWSARVRSSVRSCAPSGRGIQRRALRWYRRGGLTKNSSPDKKGVMVLSMRDLGG